MVSHATLLEISCRGSNVNADVSKRGYRSNKVSPYIMYASSESSGEMGI